ncbi:Major facilitator superfamily domain containing protein [Rhypophila sp. PSN 637]
MDPNNTEKKEITSSSASNDLEDGSNSPPELSKGKLVLVLVALCLAVFLAAIDAVIITPAMPTIAKDLNASDAGFAWIGSAYLLAPSATAPLWSKVSDIFGRKPILIMANIIFLVGSLVAALSNSLPMLIAARRERGLFYGINRAVWAVATAIGPIIGGAFTEYATWRWCFWFNLPFDGPLSLIITILFLHIHNPKTPLLKGLKAIDWLGSILIISATLMFLIGLESGGTKDSPWTSPLVICLIIFGLLPYFLFAIWQRFAQYPSISRRIFATLPHMCTFAVVFSHGAGFIAPVFFLPLYFQSDLGASPLQSGICQMLALAVSFTLSGIIMGVFIQKMGHYIWIIRASMGLFTLALGLMITFDEERNWAKIVCFQVVLAAGIGANMQTLVIAIQALVDVEDIAVATGTLNLSGTWRRVLVSLLGRLYFGGFLGGHGDELTCRQAGIDEHVVGRLVNGGAIAASTSSGGGLMKDWTEAQGRVYRAAVADGLSRMWIFYTALVGMGFVLTFGITKRELRTEHEVTRTGLEAEEAKRMKYQAGLAERARDEETN